MEHLFKKFLSSAMLCGIATVVVAEDNNHGVVNQYNNRPQSLNSARKVAGEVPGSALVHLWDREGYYGYFGAAFEYDKSFRPEAIARSLFGDLLIRSGNTNGDNCKDSCETSSILVQGTGVENRSARAIRAEDLYLGSDFESVLTFKPEISNFILDFQFYVGFDECWEGGYFRLYAPFVHTKWNLNMCETVVTEGTNVPTGLFTPNTIDTAQLLKSASEYFRGQQPTSPLVSAEGAQTPYSVTRAPLCSARILANECKTDCNSDNNDDNNCNKNRNCANTKNGFGDIRAELGWNFWQCEDYHLGLNIQGAAPTGNSPDNTYLFSPVVGNGKHWELGGGLTGHYIWCRSSDEERHFGVYVDAMVTHLFNNTQERTFDLKGKPLSRYMLAVQHAAPVNTTLALSGSVLPGANATAEPSNPTLLTSQFSGAFTPVANLTRQKVRVSVGAQGDVSLWFNYTGCGLSWDLGYNFYGRSCEKFSCSNSCPSRLENESNTWALKGNAHVYGFFANQPADYGIAANQPVALAVSQSLATITCTPDNDDGSNVNVDRAQFANANPRGLDPASPINNRVTLITLSDETFVNGTAIKTSTQPIFLGTEDIDYNQGSRYISNKIFTHVSYKWSRNACWEPFLGIGGEVEFGNSNGSRDCNDNCPTPVTTTCATANTCQPCDSCVKIGTSKWGVWLKTGLAFN